jgi:N-acetyl-anhydromuramyl-L-alanine amidase AmpD
VTKLYPKVVTVFRPAVLSRGPWVTVKPVGITIHHAADRDLEQVEAYGAAEKVGYHIIIDRDGKAHQTTYLDTCVAHAGKANWRRFSPNRSHIAVCVLSWGRLTRVSDSEYKSWAKQDVPMDSVAWRPDNVKGEMHYWDEATEAQEDALWECLEWLCKEFKIDPDNICGHDEAALPRGRKDDPGGVLSLPMPKVREHIKSLLKSKT